MLPYTLTLLLVWYITTAYGLPASPTPTSILSEVTPTSIPDPSLENVVPALGQLRSGIPGIENASPTATKTSHEEVVARQQTIPAYTPIATPAPDQDEKLASLGYYQTTYYACHTRDGRESCGWHIPIMKAGAGRIGEKTEVLLGLVIGLVIFWILL